MTIHNMFSKMRPRFSGRFVLAGAILLASFAATATEPPNLQNAKNNIMYYYQSGEYTRDVEKVTQQAKFFLATKINEVNKAKAACTQNSKTTPPQTPPTAITDACHPKLAIILDIDDTALSDLSSTKELGFGGRIQDFKANEKKAEFPAVPAVLDLYRFAKAHGYAVFFITGRSHDEKQATEFDLHKVGYKNWDGIYYKPANYSSTHHTAAIYKSAVRKQLEEQGYDIVINVGDQWSDLEGGYADRNFKIPNPAYFIP